MVGRKIILTNGFIKKTQKTQKSEIEKAKRYRDDYPSEFLLAETTHGGRAYA